MSVNKQITPSDAMYIDTDVTFKPGVYYIPNGLIILEDGITVDGNGALLVGKDRNGRGVNIQNRKGVTIKNLRLRDYQHGIYAKDCEGLSITGCQITSTAEVEANTIFLDIWLTAEKAYGGGILLERTTNSTIQGNDLQHQMNGLLTYACNNLSVRENNASYCSGWGFHLYQTSHSIFEDNRADYCCRWEPRPDASGDIRRGHMGADAAGFLIVYNSSNNIFRRNLARLGGDGFFLAGLCPIPVHQGSGFEPAPCNDNLFEENDGSWSPNIAFEATFSSGNVYRNNHANHCNYGFWLGFSRDNVIENNQINHCAQAGIAVENGINFQVIGNMITDNNHGVLLWSKYIPEFLDAVPENITSSAWLIENNRLIHNNIAVRIAANQDHGIRDYKVPEGKDSATWYRPHNHTVRKNMFEDNRVGIEALDTDRTISENNVYRGNVETNERII